MKPKQSNLQSGLGLILRRTVEGLTLGLMAKILYDYIMYAQRDLKRISDAESKRPDK